MAASPAPQRCALVTTLLLPAGGASVVVSFVRWHLHVGFERIYLYFDEAVDEPVGWAELTAAFGADDARLVRARRGPELLDAQRATCACWRKFGAFAGDEVQARQALNAEHAARAARAAGLRWLAHLDVDELFHAASPEAFAAHFAALDAGGVGHCTYANHEGVAERRDVGDYFAEVTLFKTNHHLVPLSANAVEAMRWWRSKSGRGQYLLCYDNGKSAVRLVDGVAPTSVHAWALPAGCGLRRRTALADARHLRVGDVAEDAATMPCVLHYVTCGEFWLRTKYEILGDFGDAWFGGDLPIAPSYHLDARDVVRRRDAGALRAFYAAHLDVPDAQTLARHVASGALRRVEGPRALLRPDARPPPPPPAAAAAAPAAAPPAVDVAAEKAFLLSAAAARFL